MLQENEKAHEVTELADNLLATHGKRNKPTKQRTQATIARLLRSNALKGKANINHIIQDAKA